MTDTTGLLAEIVHSFLLDVDHDPEAAARQAGDLLAAIPTDLLAAVVAERSGPVLFEGTSLEAYGWFRRGECALGRLVRVVAIDQETDRG